MNRPAGPPRPGPILGEFAPPLLPPLAGGGIADHPVEGVVRIRGLLDDASRSSLTSMLVDRSWVAVDRHGRSPLAAEQAAGWRCSTRSPALADQLWRLLRPHLPAQRSGESLADGGDAVAWRPVGCNELLRILRYEPGDHLVPHYDAPYDWPDGRRTMQSVLVALAGGGVTEMVTERPGATGWHDWDEPARATEVLAAVALSPGDAMVFDHRMLHAGRAVGPGEQKVLLRTDVAFTRVCS